MSQKPLLRVLEGEAVWPPPIWLMRQAGRYLPEYRAIRDTGGGFIARCTTPDLAVEITLQPIRRFAMDGAILFSDILILPWALGQDVQFINGEGPVLAPVRDATSLAALNIARLADATAPVLEALRRLKLELPAQTTLIGFAGSPFTVACYMVDGGGSRDFVATRKMAYTAPDLFGQLMTLVTNATIQHLSAQIDAGADTVMLFDSWAGILPPSEFERLVIAPTKAIVNALNLRHPMIRIIGFPRLAGVMAAHYAERTGVDCLALDTAADPARIAAGVPESVALQGNLDPIALIAGGNVMRDQASTIARSLCGRPHVFNLGHGILPETPVQHVADLVAHVRGLS